MGAKIMQSDTRLKKTGPRRKRPYIPTTPVGDPRSTRPSMAVARLGYLGATKLAGTAPGYDIIAPAIPSAMMIPVGAYQLDAR